MKQRIAAYLRVSTSDQSTDLQKREILEYLVARGWSECTTFYEDKATGTSSDREMLKKLLSDARRRKVDIIIVWKLDRFFRSLKGLILTLQELNELGVEFISLRDNIDFTTSAGRLMGHILGAFAEFEASIIRERVLAGLANARSKGRKLGRPKTRDDVKIAHLHYSGMSIRKIASFLGISKGAVQNSLAVLKVQGNPTSSPVLETVSNLTVEE